MGEVLDGSIILVTGAGGGIGGATVTALRAAGATVIATDLRAPDGGDVNFAQDVTSETRSTAASARSTAWSTMPAWRWSTGSRTRRWKAGAGCSRSMSNRCC